MEAASTLRLASFLTVFLLVAWSELLWPRRRLSVPKTQRWLCNLTIAALDAGIVRLMAPLLPVAIANLAEVRGWGCFNLLALPYWLAFILTVVALDLLIYLQHRLFHRIPFFWRLHRMHHTDLDLDVSSGNRFHPLEILLSLLIKVGAVLLLGAPAMAVLVFEVALNATSLFNHGNLRIPIVFDRYVRLCVVTPDMHRVHHSIRPEETDSNFGFNLPWWDRLLGTYRDQPRQGHEGVVIGLKEFRDPQRLGLFDLLKLPFQEGGRVKSTPLE
ncbi:MAG: sterol desaturase family protein [Desulfuromonadales bacterium]|nr:sterol desaturase family protein [Desulfuromonadales bacterium]